MLNSNSKKVYEMPSFLIQTSTLFCAKEKLKHHFSDLEVARVVGSDPWANLEVPDQVNAAIDRFLVLS